MKKLVKYAAVAVVKTEQFLARHAKVLVIVGVFALGSLGVYADDTAPDATSIATNAQTAFGVIAPITITIAGFYVILRIAKRVVS
ncbi:MAG TPA: hypothetical protein VHG71_06635 [Verrucomicrobiae bacterium]|nr:hypothetical protein [Verrucomicrobiae bacterium]